MVVNNTRIDSFSGYVEPFDELRYKLELGGDWIITSVTSFDYDEPPKGSWTMHSSGLTIINIEHRRMGSYVCPECSSSARLKQYRIRKLHHVRGYGYDTVLRVRIPQIVCEECGKASVSP